MAFTVEDGTGLPNANSYASVETADAYFADLQNATWAALSVDAKQSALIQATMYIDTRWKDFRGCLLNNEQALQFPRKNMYVAPDGLPEKIVQACVEYAVRASVAPLAPDTQFDATGRLYIKKLTKVGPITTEYDYGGRNDSIGNYVSWRPYAIPDALVRRFIRSQGQVIRN